MDALLDLWLNAIYNDHQVAGSEAHLLDMMMMIHAEHGGGNNSTFVCRALSSSGTDTYSAIAGAVGSLKATAARRRERKGHADVRDVKAHVDCKG